MRIIQKLLSIIGIKNVAGTQVNPATEDTLTLVNNKLVTGIDIGDVTVNNGSGADAVNVQDGGNTITVDGSVNATCSGAVSVSNMIPAVETGLATQTTLTAINTKLVTGTDIGDVTINNANGASAVNIQDGGNTITVDGTVTVGSIISVTNPVTVQSADPTTIYNPISVLTYDAEGNIATQTKGGKTRTFTWTAGDLTNISAWS